MNALVFARHVCSARMFFCFHANSLKQCHCGGCSRKHGVHSIRSTVGNCAQRPVAVITTTLRLRAPHNTHQCPRVPGTTGTGVFRATASSRRANARSPRSTAAIARSTTRRNCTLARTAVVLASLTTSETARAAAAPRASMPRFQQQLEQDGCNAQLQRYCLTRPAKVQRAAHKLANGCTQQPLATH